MISMGSTFIFKSKSASSITSLGKSDSWWMTFPSFKMMSQAGLLVFALNCWMKGMSCLPRAIDTTPKAWLMSQTSVVFELNLLELSYNFNSTLKPSLYHQMPKPSLSINDILNLSRWKFTFNFGIAFLIFSRAVSISFIPFWREVEIVDQIL